MKAVHYPQNEQQIAHEGRFHRQEALHTYSRESLAHWNLLARLQERTIIKRFVL